MWWKVPKIWEGSTCYIIGGGPSIIKQFGIPLVLVDKVYKGLSSPIEYSPYLEPLHDKHVIAVNMAYRLGDWIDMVFYGDVKYGDTHIENLRNHPALIVSCVNSMADTHKGVKYLAMNPRKLFGITDNPSQLSWNKNSGSAAINLAVHTGVKRIVLLGFDMSLDENKNQHWHKFYSGNPVTVVSTTIKKHLMGFPQMIIDLKKLGIEVVNCSPESKIEGFPKVNFKDLHV